jgi:hypothetical protein
MRKFATTASNDASGKRQGFGVRLPELQRGMALTSEGYHRAGDVDPDDLRASLSRT